MRLAVAGFSWTVRAWAERATGDGETNRELRHTLMDPLEIPVVAVVVAAIVVLSISRLLLAIPSSAATYVIIVLAVVVFAWTFLLASRPHLKRSVVLGVILVGGLVLIGGWHRRRRRGRGPHGRRGSGSLPEPGRT